MDKRGMEEMSQDGSVRDLHNDVSKQSRLLEVQTTHKSGYRNSQGSSRFGEVLFGFGESLDPNWKKVWRIDAPAARIFPKGRDHKRVQTSNPFLVRLGIECRIGMKENLTVQKVRPFPSYS
jgi:hypothetical protein